MTDRKHPSAAFWITVALVVVLAAYPLSWGPVTWLRTRHYIPNWLDRAVVLPYSPVFLLAKAIPAFDVALRRYSTRWYPPDYPPCFLPYIEQDD